MLTYGGASSHAAMLKMDPMYSRQIKKGIATVAKVVGGIAGVVALFAPTLSYDGLLWTGGAVVVGLLCFLVLGLMDYGDPGPDDEKPN